MTDKPLTIAVLAATDDGVIAHWARAGHQTVHEPADPGRHLLTWMEHRGIDQAWLWTAHAQPGPLPLPDGWTAGPHSDAWRVFYHQGVYGAREVAPAHLDERAPWRTAESPLTLLQGLLLYAKHVGPWRWGPGSTGTRLMRETYPHAAPCPNLPDIARRGTVERAPAWCRRVEPGELRAGRWIHAYDRNGLYLAACSSVELGLGECAHWTRERTEWLHPDAPHPFKLPGYWRLGGPGPEEWVTTPTLAVKWDGPPRDILEGYYWPHHARALEPWYARLRDARAALLARDDAPARLALAALKTTYTQALGWIGHVEDRDENPEGGEDHPKYGRPEHRAVYAGAPDWRHQVVATAGANLLRALRKLGAAGVDVLGVWDVDTAFVLSDSPHGHPLVKTGTGLGEWKWKGRIACDGSPFGTLSDVAARMREEGKRHAHAG